ncbi:MAG: hypothetical protein MUD02_00550 [Bacteroidales bacterium]|jgi:hypothetical protein|nr:hypothetical protein [Bacteroidales bacterium]MCU0407415.1 hypothetical protein [Bacteroidales bacterium]
MRKLEEHIRQHRDDLDIYEAPSGTWEKVSRDLDRRKPLFPVWLRAAAVIALLAGSAVIFLKSQGLIMNRGLAASEDSREGSPAMLLKESEIYYTNLLNTMYIQAEPMLSANPDIEKEFRYDMAQLDSICTSIRKDLKDNVDNAEVVEALIRNYRIRITILEELLISLRESNNEKEKTDGDEI